MLISCLQCGKMTSSKLDSCPYCKTSVASVVEELVKLRHPRAISTTERFKDTILSYVMH